MVVHFVVCVCACIYIYNMYALSFFICSCMQVITHVWCSVNFATTASKKRGKQRRMGTWQKSFRLHHVLIVAFGPPKGEGFAGC